MSNPNISRAAKPAARAAAKPAAKPTVRSAAKPVARAAAKPAAKSPVRAAAKPVARPAAKKPVAKKAAAKVAAPAKAVVDTTKLYKLLTGVDDSAFCQKVTDHIEAGYTLHGSPAITVKGTQLWVAQAVTRKPKAKPKAKGKKK
jgi:hypothetical protein